MPGSPYSVLVRRVVAAGGEVFPFHVGDTWMEPAVGCRMEDLTVADHPGMHRYAPVQGIGDLIDAIVDRVPARTDLPIERDEVLVTAGATGGLGAVVGGLVSPGDEVLILAPYWPLIAGIVRSFHATPVPVDVLDVDPVEAVAAAISDRTVALYVNTPNNPTGRVIGESTLRSLAGLAADHDLWVLADEVYEDYVYDGTHTPMRPLAPQRTFSCHSFSKAYGMAGNRAGYVVGPADAMAAVRKVGVHTVYSTPTASQLAAARALGPVGQAWVDRARARYAEVGRRAALALGVAPPQGSTFLWLDVAQHLDDRGLDGLLADAGDRGLLLAPGPSFGPYPHHVRMCFTATRPEVTDRGVARLADLLGR